MKTEAKIISSILDDGLGDSTWRENHPEAYDDLLKYRLDLEISVSEFIPKDDWALRPAFLLTEAADPHFEPLVLDGDLVDLIDYKRWYSRHNRIKLKSIVHRHSHIVSRMEQT